MYHFSKVLGLHLNPVKCSAFLQCACSDSAEYSSYTVTGFRWGISSVKFLGLLLVASRVREQDCQPLILVVQFYAIRLLTVAGRCQLIK